MKPQKAPLRVLLTDDDEDDRLIFKEIIDELDRNIDLRMVNDGKQLLEFLKNETNPLPDIIFLDLNMPNMSGVECLQEIRSHERFSDISIAIYSTSTSKKDIDDTFYYGANIYITKPAAFNELKEVVEKSLSAVRFKRDSNFNKSNFVLKI